MKAFKSFTLLIWLFLPTIILLYSCTSTHQVNGKDINLIEDETLNKIQLKSGEVIELNTDYGTNIVLHQDTAIVKLKDNNIKKIPVSEIIGYEINKVNVAKSILLGFTILIVPLILVAILSPRESSSCQGPRVSYGK